MAGCWICNFFKRTILYQILIIIAALKLKNAFRYNKEFVNRIRSFLESIKLPETLVSYLPKNNEWTHKGFLITLIVLASFSILGINFFKILSGIGCILLAFLYHNPIPKFKELFKNKLSFNIETLEQNLPELEFILYICIAFAMFGNAFEQICKKDKESGKEKDIEEEREEIKNNNEDSRESAKKSGNNKSSQDKKSKGKIKGKPKDKKKKKE